MRLLLILIILIVSVFIAFFLNPLGAYEKDQLQKDQYSQPILPKSVVLNSNQPAVDKKTQSSSQKGVAEQSLEILDTMSMEEYH